MKKNGPPVRWGVLGAAKIALNQVIPAMKRCSIAQLSAIASRDQERAERTADEFGMEHAYGSYEKLLSDPSIDAVYIPLPNHLHVEWSIKAMEAGKHVLCEKPLALSMDDIRALMKVRDKTGMKIGEAFMVRSHPQWKKAKELTEKKTIGELQGYQAVFTYFNREPLNIRNNPAFGGGGLWDIGCYPVHTSRYLFGEEPLRVLAAADFDPEFRIDRFVSAILEFPSGQASFICGTQTSPYQRVQILGTGKRVEIEIPFNAPTDRETIVYLHSNSLHRSPDEIFSLPVCNQYTLQGDDFSRAIIEDTEVPVPLEDSLGNTAVLEALYRSAGNGAWESI